MSLTAALLVTGCQPRALPMRRLLDEDFAGYERVLRMPIVAGIKRRTTGPGPKGTILTWRDHYPEVGWLTLSRHETDPRIEWITIEFDDPTVNTAEIAAAELGLRGDLIFRRDGDGYEWIVGLQSKESNWGAQFNALGQGFRGKPTLFLGRG